MSQIDELIMIIPVVLNLKGNLEMNLSARLGTSANMGELDKPSTRRTIILGNLTLLQVQATVVSFIAACVSFAVSAFLPHRSPTQITGETSSNSTVVLSITETLHDHASGRPLRRPARPPRIPRPPNVPVNEPGGFPEFVAGLGAIFFY